MQNTFVDFDAVKQAVTMRMVLDHYQVKGLRAHGHELYGRCPIHKGEGADAFRVSVQKNAFNCFSCHARGNVLDFVAAMERCTVREAAVKLQDWFSVRVSEHDQQQPSKTSEQKSAPSSAGSGGEQVETNPPLRFQLKGVDPAHPYLEQRGITKDITAEFGIGYFSGKGSMSGRVVIPIHNERGELVAYAGRAIDDRQPWYKLPVGFHKSLELFNLHRAKTPASVGSTVVLVEGFFD